MIKARFDYGWGPEWPVKAYEQQVLAQYLAPLQDDGVDTAIVNSVWYGEQEHQHTVKQLDQLGIQRVILVSMIDAAILRPEQFDARFDTVCVGSYPGLNHIDFWSLVLDRFWCGSDSPASAADIDTAFLCYNRKPHRHRKLFYQQLQDHEILDSGIVTMGTESGIAERALPGDVAVAALTPNHDAQQNGIVNDIMSLGPQQNWQRCFMNIVTETVYDVDNTWFVSEKIYKPMLGQRPFLVFAPNGARGWLHHFGFEDYCRDFDDITDLDLGEPLNIVQFLMGLVNQPVSYLQKKYLELLPKIMYNHSMFEKHVHQQKTILQRGIICPI